MKEYFEQSHMTSTANKDETQTLRGYDPLQEIYHWHMISSLLISELVLVSIAAIPIYSSTFMLTSGIFWGIRLGTLAPFLFLLGITPFFLRYRRYRREKQERARLREEAMAVSASGQALPQSHSPAAHGLSLPFQIKSQRKSFFTIRTICGIVLFAILLLMNYIMAFAISWNLSFLLMAAPTVLGMTTGVALSAAISRDIPSRIAGHYLLPSLNIDDEAITARYGRDTISIPWRDICYFALVDSITFRKLPVIGQASKVHEREAYEISDGENGICWLKASPFSSHRLLRAGEISLSDQDYATFTQQLATLIVERTGLPLYDLRLTKQRARKNPQS